MRIKLILTNHQVENQSHFLLTVPFSVSTFADFNEYLKEYFELPETAHLSFNLEGFCIMHKENIHQILKEFDTLKITLVNKDVQLHKRKGSLLSQSSIRKQQKVDDKDSKFSEFINDMLSIQRRIENEQREGESSFDEEVESESEEDEKNISKIPKISTLNVSKQLGGDKKQKAGKSKQILEKIKSFNQTLSRVSNKKQNSDSSDSSDDSSSESEAEQKKVVLDRNDNPKDSLQSKKYQKIFEKETASIKKAVDVLAEAKMQTPIQSTFQKGGVLKQLNDVKSNQVKIIDSKQNQQQQQQTVTQQILAKAQPQIKILSQQDKPNTPQLPLRQQQQQPQQQQQWQQKQQQNQQQTVNKINNPEAPKLGNIQKLKQNVAEIVNLNQESAKKPTININPVINQKKKQINSSSDSSSSSSSSDDSDNEEKNTKQNKQPKIQLSFQKQSNSIPIKPTIVQSLANQNQIKNDSNSKTITPIKSIIKSDQNEANQNSTQTTPSSKPTLQPILKGPNKDHVMTQLTLKSPLEEYEEKKPIWKEISGFQTKMDKKLQKQQNQNEQQNINNSNANKNATKSQNQTNNTSNQPKLQLQMNDKRQVESKITDNNPSSSNNSFKFNTSEIPPFDLTGYDKINLKDMIDYEKNLNKNFFNEHDLIYFNEIELDEETSCPKASLWKRGTITQILNVKKVRVSVVVGTKVESSVYDTTVFNALYLKPFTEPVEEKIQEKKEKSLEKKEYVQQKKDKSQENKEIVPESKQIAQRASEELQTEEQSKSTIPISSINTTSQYSNNNFRVISDKDILVGRQVNYYYGDRNYFQDKYLLEHSNRNEGHYMPLSLLMNFPKIKKEVDSIEDLQKILLSFIKKTVQVVNYELSQDLSQIRKIQQTTQQGKNFGKYNNQEQRGQQNQNNNARKNNGPPQINSNLLKNNNNYQFKDFKNNSGVNPKLSNKMDIEESDKQIENNESTNNTKKSGNPPQLNSSLFKKNETTKEEAKKDENSIKQDKLEIEEGEDSTSGSALKKNETHSSADKNENKVTDEVQQQITNDASSQQTITQQIVQNVQEQIIKEINQKAQHTS